MRLIIPIIRIVVWGEESPKTIVRMFFFSFPWCPGFVLQ